MAQRAEPPSFRASALPSFDVLGSLDQPWTAQLALDLLPESMGPKVEVVRGCVVVTPDAGYEYQLVERELVYLLRRAARRAGFWAYPEVNIVSGNDLFIPDFVVLTRSGAGQETMPINTAVMLGEIVVRGHRRRNVIDRALEYAEAEVPYFLRVDLRHRTPALVLHELVDGEYQAVAAAAAGSLFTMREPFDLDIDPGDLLVQER